MLTDAELDEIARRIEAACNDPDVAVAERAKEDVAFRDAARLLAEIRLRRESEQRLIRAAGEMVFEQREHPDDKLGPSELVLRNAWRAWRDAYRTTPKPHASGNERGEAFREWLRDPGTSLPPDFETGL